MLLMNVAAEQSLARFLNRQHAFCSSRVKAAWARLAGVRFGDCTADGGKRVLWSAPTHPISMKCSAWVDYHTHEIPGVPRLAALNPAAAAAAYRENWLVHIAASYPTPLCGAWRNNFPVLTRWRLRPLTNFQLPASLRQPPVSTTSSSTPRPQATLRLMKLPTA